MSMGMVWFNVSLYTLCISQVRTLVPEKRNFFGPYSVVPERDRLLGSARVEDILGHTSQSFLSRQRSCAFSRDMPVSY